MKRLMYVECKDQGLDGPGRIGWVELSKSKRSYRYQDRLLQKCVGYKYNCVDVETGTLYWVSGPKRDGRDKLYGGRVEIDADARAEYWTVIRRQPERAAKSCFRAGQQQDG
ncbi:MAG: hypothetical protein U0872_05995 [Planctomycetaceae bacterium]